MINAALADLPKASSEPPSFDPSDDTAPDVVAIPPNASKRRRPPWWPIALLLVIGAAAGAWYWYAQVLGSHGGQSGAAANNVANRQNNGKASLGFAPAETDDSAKTNAPTTGIETVPVQVVWRSDVLKLTGSLMADERSSVASNTSGIAAEVRVDRGSLVKKNDILVQIDPTDAINKLKEGKAALEELKARLEIKGDTEEDLKNFIPTNEPEVQLAKASADLAAANLKRAEENVAKKVISKEAFDQTDTEYKLAFQRYRQSLLQINQVFQMLQTAQIKLAILKKAVDDTAIRAPFDGWVAEKLVAPGEQISSGMQATKVVTLVRVDPLRLSLTVPQQEIGRIRLGQAVRFFVDSYPDHPFDAEVQFIGPVVTNDTRSMVVEAVASNHDKDRRLRPGLFATAELELPRRQRSVLAPLGAVLRSGEVSRVFVVRDGVAHEQVVAIGDVDGGKIEISSGLTGKEILVANPERVHAGDAVRP